MQAQTIYKITKF